MFEWIIAQPNCDKGTILSIYYRAQPDYYNRYASIEEALASGVGSDEIVPLLVKICEMWGQGSYPSYAYRPSEIITKDYLSLSEEALLTMAAGAPWDVPDGLAKAGINGEPNLFEQTVDGIPVEMLRALGEDW